MCNFQTFVYDSGMRSRAFLLAIGCGIALQSAIAMAGDAYKLLTEIPIGGWDILMVDPAARRLYLSHATKVVVVDIDANKVVGEIAELPRVHAFVAVPELQRGFSSNGKENTLVY